MTDMLAGHAIVEVLKAENVKAVFGLPGGHVLGIYDALYDTPSIKNYLVRHEFTAAAMAAAYFQLTGELAVCLVTAGPGATNLLTAVTEAYVGSVPMVILAGRGATDTVFRGASQEVDTNLIFGPVTKLALRVDRADLLVPALRQAFQAARSGKPGPAIIDIPRDLLTHKVNFSVYIPVGLPARISTQDDTLKALAAALHTAKNPIINAGGGCVGSDAGALVTTPAEQLAIPVLTSLSGRGIIADDHPLSAGGMGAHRNALSKCLFAEADVVLGLGTRFEEMETNWRPGFVPSPGACYIQVDIDPTELGRSIPANIGIVGDIRTVIEALLPRIADVALPRGSFLTHPRTLNIKDNLGKIEAEYSEMPKTLPSGLLHPLNVIRRARAIFPREATTAFDVGCLAQHMAGGKAVFPVYQQRSVVSPSSFYGMGYVASGVLAGPIARPDKPALCFVGDGSFQMVLPILPVATHYKLGVTWCVLNDGALGSIRDIQEFGMKNRVIDTDFAYQPDFAAIAAGCGCLGVTVRHENEIDTALQAALEANRRGQAAVLDVHVSRERLQGTFDHYLFYGRAIP